MFVSIFQTDSSTSKFLIIGPSAGTIIVAFIFVLLIVIKVRCTRRYPDYVRLPGKDEPSEGKE